FGKVDGAALNAQQRGVYCYNFGRALEGNGDLTQAFKQYTNAVGQQPDFEQAVEGAFRALRLLPTPQVDDAASFAEQLLAKGRALTAYRHLCACLDLWRDDPNVLRLLTVLVNYYAAN